MKKISSGVPRRCGTSENRLVGRVRPDRAGRRRAVRRAAGGASAVISRFSVRLRCRPGTGRSATATMTSRIAPTAAALA